MVSVCLTDSRTQGNLMKHIPTHGKDPKDAAVQASISRAASQSADTGAGAGAGAGRGRGRGMV